MQKPIDTVIQSILPKGGPGKNVASRMESHGLGGTIQITRATYDLIRDNFVC